MVGHDLHLDKPRPFGVNDLADDLLQPLLDTPRRTRHRYLGNQATWKARWYVMAVLEGRGTATPKQYTAPSYLMFSRNKETAIPPVGTGEPRRHNGDQLASRAAAMSRASATAPSTASSSGSSRVAAKSMLAS